MKRFINTFSTNHISALLCLLLIAHSTAATADSSETDWVKDEILQQLTELRKEVKSLKSDISRLDKKLDEVARPPAAPARPTANAPKQVKLDSDTVLGDNKAKFAIVEFSDYQCPFCARHSKSVLPQIKKNLINTGKIKYLMYDYPLGFHTQAKSAAVAARCAGKQNQYWAMHDTLFENIRGLNQALFNETAKALKLDTKAFAACIKDPGMTKAVEDNMAYGNQLGVSGTPKFYVGRIKGDVMTDVIVISGAQGYGAFSSAIQKLEKKR